MLLSFSIQDQTCSIEKMLANGSCQVIHAGHTRTSPWSQNPKRSYTSTPVSTHPGLNRIRVAVITPTALGGGDYGNPEGRDDSGVASDKNRTLPTPHDRPSPWLRILFAVSPLGQMVRRQILL